MYSTYIKSALDAAKYHEDQAFSLKGLKIQDNKIIVWHLRAYYWELWSIWDYILQQANAHTLHKDPIKVRGNIIDDIKKSKPEYKYLSFLEKGQNSEALKRIMYLRNYAHKWQINPYLVEHNDERVTVISLDNHDLKDKNLPKQINVDKNDLWFMRETVDLLNKEGYFNKIIKA